MKRKIIYALLIVVLLGLNFVYSYFNIKYQAIYDKTLEESTYSNVGQVADSTVIKQTFTCERKMLKSIEIKVMNYDRDNKTKLYYKVEDGDLNIVAEGTIDASKIDNNKFLEIEFDKKINSENVNYTLTIGDDKTADGMGITFYTAAKKGDGKLSVEGIHANTIKSNDALVMKLVTTSFDLETFIIITCFEMFIFLFIKILYKFLR